MLDHLGISVTDFSRSRAFYAAVLRTLGYAPVLEVGPEETGGPNHCGFGAPGRPQFWIGEGAERSGPIHVAFAAADRAAVDAFYEVALAEGATDNGPPGLRPQYHPDYYGAFVRDPDGHNIEAVCHQPQ
jgi:catechol 2,3-dioxygenase-like lactoylglutathione lyase family enzyme